MRHLLDISHHADLLTLSSMTVSHLAQPYFGWFASEASPVGLQAGCTAVLCHSIAQKVSLKVTHLIT